ncbi:MAG TPA: EVE domain-containing protein [Ktedonobacterales bacterium]
MSSRTYWLDLFTWATWQEFRADGGTVSGFRENRWNTVQQVKPGDYLLCYLTGVSRWIGVLEVVSEPFMDHTPIWKDATFPCRVRVTAVAALTPETAVPIELLRDKLSIFENMNSPTAWTGHLRGSPAKWKTADAEIVVAAIMDAQRHPVKRPVDEARLRYRPRTLEAAKLGPVTVPENDDRTDEEPKSGRATAAEAEPTLHTEVQWQLLKLGCDMGLDVWVARNDRGRGVNGRRFADLPSLKSDLPLQFDEATNKTIELIDVLWLRGNAIVAAFEIECTTSIYSGLLRMADLIAMQPNLNIPLYLVAPEDRRNKVISEVNRPTFSRLSPPMKRMCRFISIPALQERIGQVAPVVRYLRPEFLQELSENCELDEA